MLRVKQIVSRRGQGGFGRILDFAAVRAELAAGNRVLLLVRHAERPHIDHADPTFGGGLPLTANGVAMCETFGRALAGASDDVQFVASPLRRTVMTAESIARGMGLGGVSIPTDDVLGNGSQFYTDRLEVWRMFRDGRFFDRMEAYLRDGVLRGFNPIGPAAEEHEEYVLARFTAQLGIFTTHDVFIVAYLHAKGVKTDWCADNWPRFLDAAAIVVEPSGRRRPALLRAGLSDRAVGVA